MARPKSYGHAHHGIGEEASSTLNPPPERNTCESCQGRGWFSVDMMGSAFYHCKQCNTHETVNGPYGSYVILRQEQTHDTS